MADEHIEGATREEEALGADSVVIGLVVGFSAEGSPSVSFPGCSQVEGVAARSTVALAQSDIGKSVALLFEGGNIKKPLISGKIAVPGPLVYEPKEKPAKIETSLDGERLTLTADREIVLRCGKASITLTRAGKIIIRGAYLLNRSSGVNKIKGASVQIN